VGTQSHHVIFHIKDCVVIPHKDSAKDKGLIGMSLETKDTNRWRLLYIQNEGTGVNLYPPIFNVERDWLEL
jgi:hypothetical protein